MQDRYAGDVGDFGKFSFLSFVSYINCRHQILAIIHSNISYYSFRVTNLALKSEKLLRFCEVLVLVSRLFQDTLILAISIIYREQALYFERRYCWCGNLPVLPVGFCVICIFCETFLHFLKYY